MFEWKIQRNRNILTSVDNDHITSQVWQQAGPYSDNKDVISLLQNLVFIEVMDCVSGAEVGFFEFVYLKGFNLFRQKKNKTKIKFFFFFA